MERGVRAIPSSDRFVLRRARLPRVLVAADAAGRWREAASFLAADITIEAGRVAALRPAEAGDIALPSLDLSDGIVLPRFVDGHTHLDKGHILPRAANPDGTFMGALTAVAADRAARWSAEDVRTRMDFSLRSAFAHGTGAIRTHIDSLAPQADISWPIFAEMRAEWAGRIALQAASIYAVDLAVKDKPQFDALVAIVARHGGVMGGVTFLGAKPDAMLDLALDRIFQAAVAHGLDLDFHVDESADPAARTLPVIARKAIEHRFKGRIVAGHCCSLALYGDEERARTLDLVAEAGIAVMSLPMCNLYLQDRVPGRTPRWRGVAPLHELDAAGVPVMVASDNTRDPFYAYGDMDMVEVFREATRILHLDHSARPWLRLLGAATADVMGFADVGTLREGMPADLVLLSARTPNELLARPQSDRLVLVGGRGIETKPPDYRELDRLFA